MEKKASSAKLIAFLAGITAAVVVVGGGAVWWALQTITASDNLSPIVINRRNSNTNTKQIQEQNAQVYWIGKNLDLLAVPVTVDKSANSEGQLAGMLRRLLAGPQNPEQTTTIPQGTKLLSVDRKLNGIHINLSQEFTNGGGSASMTGRLGQILYTATSLNPKEKVWLNVEGKPLKVLGGEGIMVEQPLTRKYFEANFK